MYRMDQVPVSDTRRRIPMDVLLVLRWAQVTIDGALQEQPELVNSAADLAHWAALRELCAER